MFFKGFRFYDMTPCRFYECVLKGNPKSETSMKRFLDNGEALAVTLREAHVEIVGTVWTATQCKVVTLAVVPDAVQYCTHGFCRCRVECWDTKTGALAWTWKRRLQYEMEDVDDLLRQFFDAEELTGLLLQYGVVQS